MVLRVRASLRSRVSRLQLASRRLGSIQEFPLSGCRCCYLKSLVSLHIAGS